MGFDKNIFVCYMVDIEKEKYMVDEKTKQVLAYICENYNIPVSITSLMKLSYLVDLVSVSSLKRHLGTVLVNMYFALLKKMSGLKYCEIVICRRSSLVL